VCAIFQGCCPGLKCVAPLGHKLYRPGGWWTHEQEDPHHCGSKRCGENHLCPFVFQEEAKCLRFINADLIAAGISPFAPETAAFKAGRLMLEEIAECVRRGDIFAFETTLSGLTYLKRIKQWRAEGYSISIFFLSLPDAEAAVARVAKRVRQGGHHISEAVIRRRFAAGLENLERVYKPAVNAWVKYYGGESPILLEWEENR